MGFLSKQVGVDQIKSEVMRELERRFSPEFRNRIDDVVLFQPLTKDEVRGIAVQQLGHLERSLSKSGRTLQVTPEALEQIVQDGYSLAYGARFLKRCIDERVKLPISQLWTEGESFTASMREGRVEIEVSTAGGQIPELAAIA
jgi:ATP-dependent Clp protease ATP-binding subunit ClpA